MLKWNYILRLLVSLCCIGTCFPVKAEADAKFKEASVYALGSLLTSKVQHLLKFEATSDVSEKARLYQDILMIYRHEVIVCAGFLDQLDMVPAEKFKPINRAEVFNEPIAIVDQLRAAIPNLDKYADRFAQEKFYTVMTRFASGNWPIQPLCASERYQATF